MTVRKVEMERFSLTSSKLFEAVVAALEAAAGQPDVVEFAKATKGAPTFDELECAVHAVCRSRRPTVPEGQQTVDLCNLRDAHAGKNQRKIYFFLPGTPSSGFSIPPASTKRETVT